MKPIETPIKKENSKSPEERNLKGIKNHKKAATHLQAAAKSHLDAATYHEAGDHQKAAQSTIAAHGYLTLATKAQKADVKQHAING